MRTYLAVTTAVVTLVGCSSGGNNQSSAMVCCAAADGAGLSQCGCQAPGTVSQGGLSSTLTVSGSSCSAATTFQGTTSMSTGRVVTSCDGVSAEPRLDGSTMDASAADASLDNGAVFVPTSLGSRLAFWFDPTSLVPSAGRVATWTDLSGHGNVATQVTPAFRPVYTLAGIHGLPAATFPGPVTFMSIADASSMQWGVDDVMVLVVARGTALSAPESMLYQKTGAFPYDAVSLYLNADKPMPTTFAGAQLSGQLYVVSASPPATFVDGSVHLLGVRRTGSTLEVRVDGAVSKSTTGAAVSAVNVSSAGADATIGQNGYGPSPKSEFQQFHGDIAEMVGVDGTVTAAELSGLEHYLKTRYAIP